LVKGLFFMFKNDFDHAKGKINLLYDLIYMTANVGIEFIYA